MGPDDTLSPSESTDSDEVAPSADGDEVVDPPEEWHGADRADDETLDQKLAAERPDRAPRPDDGDDGGDTFYSVVT